MKFYAVFYRIASDCTTVTLAYRIERDVRTLFKEFYGLRSEDVVKKLFSKFIISEEINIKKIILKIGRITKALLVSSNRNLVKKDDFLMALILHFLSDNKLKIDQLEQKLSILNTSTGLKQLLSNLVNTGYIEEENEYYKLRVLSLF